MKLDCRENADWIYYNLTDKCYKGFESTQNWKEAYEYCAEKVQGAKLVSILDWGTKTFLKVNVVPQDSQFWIGGFRNHDSKGGDWRWLDGTLWSSSYQDWIDGHPKDVNGMRLLLTPGGRYVSKNWEERHGFICQY